MTSFCNLIGGALAEPLEVNGLTPPTLSGSFLLRTDRGNEPGDEATYYMLGATANLAVKIYAVSSSRVVRSYT